MKFVAKEMKRLSGMAIHRYSMIEEGDRLLVAFSGGKDSLALLWILRERLARIPIHYDITAVHVDPGFDSGSSKKIEAFLEDQGFQYRIIRTDIGPKAHGPDNQENPCFLCARNRRKILFKTAKDLGCHKIAFGHHKDDLIETFFINLFFGASLSTMLPVQHFFGGQITAIRPLYLIDENVISRYVGTMGWNTIDLGCPSAGISKRETIKVMLNDFYRTNKKIKGNIFHALHNIRADYLPK
jgi:tRNA 2-thiocytidine biosynthesis protein TtcA